MTNQHRTLVATVVRLLGRENDPEIWAAAAHDLQNSGVSLANNGWTEAHAVENLYRQRVQIDQELRRLAQQRREVVSGLVEKRAALIVALERELVVAVLGEET